MYDLNELYFFSQIVEHEGIAPASRAIGVPKSKLSRHLAALEERLGVRLINRSTRQFTVSDLGMEYYRHCVTMLEEAKAAQLVIENSQTEPKGLVRISCPTALLNFLVAGMIARFMDRHPEVEVHLESTNREVDPLREGFDIALHTNFSPVESSGLAMKRLSMSPQMLVGSPELIARHGAPCNLADLARFPSLSTESLSSHYSWDMQGPNDMKARVLHTPRLVTDDMITLRRVALEAGGIVQLPKLVAFKDVRNGSLKPLLPDWTPSQGVVNAFFPSRRGLPLAVRALLDFLASSFSELDFENLYGDYVLRGDEDACFLTDSKLSDLNN